jgi:hypothetical protein
MDHLRRPNWKAVSEAATARLTSAERHAGLQLQDADKVKALVSRTLSTSSHLDSIDQVRLRLDYIIVRTALLYTGVHELSEGDQNVSSMLWVVLGLAVQVCISPVVPFSSCLTSQRQQ